MSNNEIIVGIDLGTTNSEIAAFVDDRPQVLGPGRSKCCLTAWVIFLRANRWVGSRPGISFCSHRDERYGV